jgi:hypothetical protein
MPAGTRVIALWLVAFVGFATFGLVGCGSSTDEPMSGASPAAVKKVSANTASEAKITAALESAGVDNADQWAEEVVEYRPYPQNDPNLGKLRANLKKYNPGKETTDLIVSALTP